MSRQCTDCYFLGRYECHTGDRGRKEVARVPWTKCDTEALSKAVAEPGAPFYLAANSMIGERFGVDCAKGIFQGVEGDPNHPSFHGHPTRLIDGKKSIQRLKKIVESPRGRNECFFMSRILGMEVEAAMELETRRYSRYRDFVSDCKSYAALAIALVAAIAAVLSYLGRSTPVGS